MHAIEAFERYCEAWAAHDHDAGHEEPNRGVLSRREARVPNVASFSDRGAQEVQHEAAGRIEDWQERDVEPVRTRLARQHRKHDGDCGDDDAVVEAEVVAGLVGWGAGSEVRHVMGVTVFFGMLGVTFFGLFFTPVFYVAIRNLVERRNARRANV